MAPCCFTLCFWVLAARLNIFPLSYMLFSPHIYCFLSLAHFSIGLLAFFLIDFQELFMYLGVDTLLVIWVVNISSQTEACIFSSLLMVSFAEQNFKFSCVCYIKFCLMLSDVHINSYLFQSCVLTDRLSCTCNLFFFTAQSGSSQWCQRTGCVVHLPSEGPSSPMPSSQTLTSFVLALSLFCSPTLNHVLFS
jgi:hypothetical protein